MDNPHLSSDPRRLPEHIGIIMDGNGRWAKARNLPRTQGHNEGLQAAKRVVKACSELGIRFLSLYTFSTENWKRTEEEVSFLMGLLVKHLKREYDFYRQNSIRVIHSGDIEGLPQEVQAEIQSVTKDTASFSGLTVNLAINYGGRNEIVRACRKWFQALKGNGDGNVSLSEEQFSKYLDHPEIPDPDMIIRTGGEMRLSNFLLWESAYAEYYFSDKLWPDWGGDDILDAIASYRKRERRFGGVR